jgi:hypothetical protein
MPTLKQLRKQLAELRKHHHEIEDEFQSMIKKRIAQEFELNMKLYTLPKRRKKSI